MSSTPPPTPPPAPEPKRSVKSEELMAGGRELVIVHNGESYTLRVTRNGKLILTK